ncbi:hypothetical protein POL68_35190 [Stigmatella sp. ncwal1]|uniref:Peptidase C58 YopT-type domain-containing protein n=1 Tax=Stigmatella ashevillensis TaxID=2995309 RepID=A0ABT5DJR3_9BACT|nr:hypothetical protein [Stigmatella ashevillena]MDC0713766.1 hypothetical protein [Stigmatella ashevillena]
MATAPRPEAPAKAPAKQKSQRQEQVSRIIEREIRHLPMPEEDRKKLERTALHPGKSADARRAASELRRAVYATRSMSRSAQENLVKPFVDNPHGERAHSAARLTRDSHFRKASTAEKELMARVFPSTSPATARGLPTVARQLSQAKLPTAQREQILRHAFSAKSDADMRLATRDVLRALKGQPEQTQQALLEPFTRPRLSEKKAAYASKLVHSPAWRSLGAPERTQLAQVLSTASPDNLRSLHTLAQLPGMLMDRDAQGGTLLSHLAQLAKGPLHPALHERRAELLNGVLEETAQSFQVDQKEFNTCTVTSMQYELVRDNPAEYARLIAGLAGPTGRVGMRGGGEIELQDDSLSSKASGPYSSAHRTLSEAIFQTSLMEFANGIDEYYVQGSRGTDESVRPDGSTYTGQYASGMVQAASALFGRAYTTWYKTPSTFDAQMEFLRNYQPAGPNTPVLISYDTTPGIVGGDHAVNFVRVEGDRVFFRNPWGPEYFLKAGDIQHDQSRVEDPKTGLYSFTIEQLRTLMWDLTVPEEARSFGAPAAA